MIPNILFGVMIAAFILAGFWVIDIDDNMKRLHNLRAGRGFRVHSSEIRALHRAKAAVTDMTTYKTKRRNEERQQWRNDYEKLAPPQREAEPPKADLMTELITAAAKTMPGHTGPLHGSVIRNMSGGTVRITQAGATPPPPPPPHTRFETADGRPIHVDRELVIGREPITINGQLAYPVRMGKFVGHYAILDNRLLAGDILLDTDQFTVLETYADGHDTTCPYECTCPKWARRWNS